MSTFIYFSALYLPHLGGVERYTNKLSKKLLELGNDVIIVTSALNNDVGITTEDGITVARLPSVALLGGRFPFQKRNAAFNEIWGELMKISVDHVLVNTRYYMLSLLGLRYARKRMLPSVVIDHSSDYLSVGNTLIDGMIRLYENVMTFRVKRYDPAFFSVSLRGVEWLRHFRIRAEGTLHNAVEISDFQISSETLGCSGECRDRRFRIVYVGRLVAEKGILKLCDAVRCLRADGYGEMLLEIAGAGPVEEEVKKYCDDSIRFLGQLDSVGVTRLLHRGNVFCLPTTYPEGFPTVLLEAAASGMGIVVTDTGGAKELIPDDWYGIVIHDDSIESIIEAILTLYHDPVYLNQVSGNLRKRVEEEFSWDKTAETLLDYCGSLLR